MMKEKTAIKLDKKDRLIMHQLEEDSRQSYAEIGRKVGLRSETVEYRMSKLIRSGVIMRMFAEPNLPKLGLKTYRVYLKIGNMPQEEEERMVSYFFNHPRSNWFAEFEGEWDYTLRYTLKDEIEFREQMEDLMRRFGKYILSKNIVITLQQSFLNISYFTGKEGSIRWMRLERVDRIEEPDRVDKSIMGLLYDNSRLSTVDIAKKVGISADAVQYRIRRLVDRGIISYFGAYFEPPAFGFGRYKVLLWLQHSTKKREEELVRFCQQHPNSSYLNRVVGSWDLELDFDTKDIQQMHDIVKDLRNRFPDLIRDHSTMVNLRERLTNPFKEHLEG
jgi:DNA-binding Lrp family transcriptional regulator